MWWKRRELILMNEFNVLYQFNDKYAPYAGVSLTSLLENNKDMENLTIYILPERISSESEEMFRRLAKNYNRKIIFIDTVQLIDQMKNIGINEYRGSYATNMKMFAPLYVDKTVERLLYIDSDTVICGSISELVDIDMQDKPIAMILDSLGARHKHQVGHGKEDPYFNGGVILFDVNKWKERRCTERIINHAQNVRAQYMAPDQDLLNVVLKGEIYKLNIEYNLQPIHFAYDFNLYFRWFGQPNYYSAGEVQRAIDNPIILHTFRFLGQFPWHKETLHPQTVYFDYYLEKSLWCNYVKETTDKNSLIFRIERWLYRYLPKVIFIVIFKMYYEFFLWKSDRDSLNNINNKNM